MDKPSTKGNQGTHSYWIRKGFSKEEAKLKVKEVFAQYKLNKIKELGSEEAYLKFRQGICSLTKENMMKKFKNEQEYMEYKLDIAHRPRKKSCRHADYWVDRGLSEEEAKAKALAFNKKTSQRCKEFWLEKGYSIDEAKQKISELQSLSTLDKFISRYGKEDGTTRYEALINQKKETTCFKDSVLQKELNSRTGHHYSSWVAQGYTIEEAKAKARLFTQERSHFSKLYWLGKGFTEEEAQKIISDQSKLASAKAEHYVISKLEERAFTYIKENIDPKVESNVKVDDLQSRRTWFPDIIGETYIVEIFGDYWHANPLIYSKDRIMYGGISAKKIWTRDKKRVTRLQHLTGKKVYIIWEKDIVEKGLEFIKEIFLKEILRENKEDN